MPPYQILTNPGQHLYAANQEAVIMPNVSLVVIEILPIAQIFSKCNQDSHF